VSGLHQEGGNSNAWSVLSIRNVRKSYVDTQQNLYTAITDISVSIHRGDFYCLLGPSGCGKSTLLNLIAGFEDVTTGSIAFSTGDATSEVPISGPGVDRAMIFQDVNDSLFPWLDTEENVAFGPKLHGVSRAVYESQLLAYLKMVGLDRHSHKFPVELSGGMSTIAATMAPCNSGRPGRRPNSGRIGRRTVTLPTCSSTSRSSGNSH